MEKSEERTTCIWNEREYLLVWEYQNGYCEIKEKNGYRGNLVKKEELIINKENSEYPS